MNIPDGSYSIFNTNDFVCTTKGIDFDGVVDFQSNSNLTSSVGYKVQKIVPKDPDKEMNTGERIKSTDWLIVYQISEEFRKFIINKALLVNSSDSITRGPGSEVLFTITIPWSLLSRAVGHGLIITFQDLTEYLKTLLSSEGLQLVSISPSSFLGKSNANSKVGGMFLKEYKIVCSPSDPK